MTTLQAKTSVVAESTRVSADELSAAFHAAQAGRFAVRHHTAAAPIAVPAGSIAVLGAHPGAGTSTVALALADAAAGAGREVELIDPAARHCSVLASVTTAELGVDGSGAWRYGARGAVTVYRREHAAAPLPESVQKAESRTRARLTVVDLGTLTPAYDRSLAGAARIVLVARCAIPALRRLEDALARLATAVHREVLVAVLGPSRWPGIVTSSLGDHVRQARADGRMVTVPRNQRLELTGPTSAPLPRRVTTAAGALLQHLDPTVLDRSPRTSGRSTHR